MSDIEDLLNKLDGEFRFDTSQILLNLVQYSIRNRKYLEMVLRNQLELRQRLNSLPENDELIEQQLEEALEEIQREVEQEYFDLLSFLSSRNKRE